jgi:hypothetical protein
MKRSVLAGLSVLALIAGPALSDEPDHKYDGVYTGQRWLTKGTASEYCPAKEDASVTIQGETLTFTTSKRQNYIVPFDPHQDGAFGETRNDASGATVWYHGQITGDLIEVDVENYVTNPPCEYHWHLKKH